MVRLIRRLIPIILSLSLITFPLPVRAEPDADPVPEPTIGLSAPEEWDEEDGNDEYGEPDAEPVPEHTIGFSAPEDARSVRISCPDSISGIIDPFNVNGNGPIDFDDVVLENTGERPVRVFITRMDWSSETITLSSVPISPETEGRVINLQLKTPDGGLYDLADGELDIDAGKIWPGEKLILSFGGKANHHFIEWKSTDAFSFNFSFDFSAG